MKDILDWIERAAEHWHRPRGLLFGIGALSLAIAALNATASIPHGYLLFPMSWGLVAVSWVLGRRPKHTPRGKFGFVVAIDCESESTRQRFRRDFVRHLKVTLSESALGDHFWFYELPDALGLTIDTLEEAKALRENVGAHFVLWGQVRTRGKGGERKHRIDLKGLVAHKPLGERNQRKLQREFSELLPQKLSIPEKFELEHFEVGSSLVNAAALYVIGVAAECLCEFEFARRLFRDAINAVSGAGVRDTNVAKAIVARVPMRFAEINVALAEKTYRRWRETKDPNNLVEVEGHLTSIPETLIEKFAKGRTLLAIVNVALHRDFQAAERLVRSCDPDDPVTRLNLAFVEAVKGNLRGASKNYRKAAELNVDLGSAEEVFEFLDWSGELPGLGAELEFCKGFIAYAILRDLELAEKHLLAFRQACTDHAYIEERKLVGKWLNELAQAKSGIKRQKGNHKGTDVARVK